ncbi:MAG: 16S rRNA (guanine(527)-N(7))-methyltransferase RsmG [Gammaproteobacteria bacterium]|jgi:16S rRNA (guanine527-N7)-methyltransferase
MKINNQYLTKNYTGKQLEQFAQYLNLMAKWNQTYNLTTITQPRNMVILHILDSLAINPFLLGSRICDVGSGAGLPGIPLAIVNPDKYFTLIDSNNKKIRFLTQVKIELKLNNIEVIHARAEKYQPQNCYNTIVSRAFSSINDMLLQTQHLCCNDGIFLAMKGIYPEKELSELKPDFKVEWIKKLKIPRLDAQRHLVCVCK